MPSFPANGGVIELSILNMRLPLEAHLVHVTPVGDAHANPSVVTAINCRNDLAYLRKTTLAVPKGYVGLVKANGAPLPVECLHQKERQYR